MTIEQEIVARVIRETIGHECLEGYFPMPVSEALVQAGADAERAAIVAWLREVGTQAIWHDQECACAIERGDHLPKDS